MRNDYRWRRNSVGDVDGDGCVNDADLLSVIFRFGQSGYNAHDLNWDGKSATLTYCRCCLALVQGADIASISIRCWIGTR